LIGPGLIGPSLFWACLTGFQDPCRPHQFSANGN
jgi:hypothetical protein